MKIYQCGNCSQLVYFESIQCVSCQYPLGFFPDLEQVYSMQQDGDGFWKPISQSTVQRYKQCYNYRVEQVCNWMVAEGDDDFCLSCRLNQVIPNLEDENNRIYWQKLEIAKRRLVYGLLQLRLPVVDKKRDPERGLAFAFLMNPEANSSERKPVMTGHDAGLITINVSEANDAYREKARLSMQERYRTLLGHFRHESGHYYWLRLIQCSSLLYDFRSIFGDEQANYDESLESYYKNGPKPNWSQQYISQYCSAHPWEDWAETWAHYLHMHNTLETAQTWGVTLNPQPAGKKPDCNPKFVGTDYSFESMCESWGWLSCSLNSMNRSMGMADIYPFVINSVTSDKLRFVHQVIRSFQEAGTHGF